MFRTHGATLETHSQNFAQLASTPLRLARSLVNFAKYAACSLMSTRRGNCTNCAFVSKRLRIGCPQQPKDEPRDAWIGAKH
jgi:hypothetical protein